MANLSGYSTFWDGQKFFDWGGLTKEEWAAVVAENCIPQSTYGPFTQTLFLGLSISSFSCSAGWNEQVGELTVQLVEDTCVGTKIYWDEDLQVRLHTAADPGFVGESVDIIGSPAYFRVSNFEFSGLIQSWEKSRTVSGDPTYTVKLVDPRQILAGAQMIIGEYAGGIGGVGFAGIFGPYNLFNVFGYMESTDVACTQTSLQLVGGLPEPAGYVAGDLTPDGAMFGSDADGFGGALINDNGMPWSTIRTGLNSLINTAPFLTSNVWSPYGRVLFKALSAGDTGSGYGLLMGDRADVLGPFTSLPATRWLAEYYIDLSELPTPPPYWRINGSNVSIMDAISQLLEDAGYDYYIELIPVRGVSSVIAPSGIAKFIKIRTVRRLLQPTSGHISTFLNGVEATVNSMEGSELRNEPTTSFLIGAKKNTYYQIESSDIDGDNAAGDFYDDDTIIPYFGIDSSENVIIPTKIDDGDGVLRWHFVANGIALDNSLQTIDVSATLGDFNIDIGELELQAAKAGYDAWTSIIDILNTDTGQLFSSAGAGGTWERIWLDAIDDHQVQDAFARDFINQDPAKLPFLGVHNDPAAKIQEDLQTIYNFVNRFATEFYGKQFQVRVPYTCVRLDGESGKILTSEIPIQTGWTDQTFILGLTNGSTLHTFLTDEDGRTETMVRFDTTPGTIDLDVSELDPDDFGVDGNSYYIRCQVSDEYVYVNKSLRTSPRAIVTIPGVVKLIQDPSSQAARAAKLYYTIIDLQIAAAKQAKAKLAIDNILKNVGNKQAFIPFDFPMRLPDGAGFGIQSQVLTYGPWVTMGPAGTVRVDHDEGLAPWNYGSLVALNVAGQSKANEGITYMQVGEKGNITIPGYPTIPLGAEIGALGADFFGLAGVHLVENRSTTAVGSVYTTTIGGWVGTYGPNITDISVSVGTNGIQTTYNMRTFTPKFGRFSRSNAEAMKRIGQNRLRVQRRTSLAIFKLKTRLALKQSKEIFKSTINTGKVVNDMNSPHELLVGSLTPFQPSIPSKRTIIASMEMKEITTQFDNFGNKAFMGWEGLIRPVSMDGDGGLPGYANFTIGCVPTNSQGAQPPIFTDQGLESGVYNETIDQNRINPFSNPASQTVRDQLEDKAHSAGDYVGHDMDLLGAETSSPEGVSGIGINMRTVGFADSDGSNYSDDYRMFAMRGPILLQSWGYDLDGRPIPNEDDTDVAASGGTFTGLGTHFLSKWLKKPHTWPVAPVDLRFDRQRGVWVAPPSYRLLFVDLLEDLCPGSNAKAQINQTKTGIQLKDGEGDNTDGYIRVYDSTNATFASGEALMVYYDSVNCQHTVIEGPQPSLFNINCDQDISNPTFIRYFNEIVAGTGIRGSTMVDNCARVLLESNIKIGGGDDNLGNTLFETLSFSKNFHITQEDDCVINIDTSGDRIHFGKLDGDLNAASSATMSIWANDPLADTTENITVYDWFLGAGETLDTGKKVKVEFYSNKWYVTTAEC